MSTHHLHVITTIQAISVDDVELNSTPYTQHSEGAGGCNEGRQRGPHN
jgi:hypothetical protein